MPSPSAATAGAWPPHGANIHPLREETLFELDEFVEAVPLRAQAVKLVDEFEELAFDDDGLREGGSGGHSRFNNHPFQWRRRVRLSLRVEAASPCGALLFELPSTVPRRG